MAAIENADTTPKWGVADYLRYATDYRVDWGRIAVFLINENNAHSYSVKQIAVRAGVVGGTAFGTYVIEPYLTPIWGRAAANTAAFLTSFTFVHAIAIAPLIIRRNKIAREAEEFNKQILATIDKKDIQGPLKARITDKIDEIYAYVKPHEKAITTIHRRKLNMKALLDLVQKPDLSMEMIEDFQIE